MSTGPRIIAFSGSLRADSLNKKMLSIAVAAAKAAGASVETVDLRELALPLYDGDLETQQGFPAGARRLQDLMIPADGLLISSPEYNSSISAALKNAIDWVTRTDKAGGTLAGFNGKVAALMAASPGGFGGLRGLVTLRSILGNLGVTVLPDQVVLPSAHQAFNDSGRIADEKLHASVEGLGKQVADIATKLRH